jgi:CSLREA domain-containing protein
MGDQHAMSRLGGTSRTARATGALVISSAVLMLLVAAPAAHGQAALTVNSTVDEPDAVANDNQCVSTPSGGCTLRAAVQEIDAAGTVTLPAGLYVLTIPAGTEATGALDPTKGDLDITQEVRIVGAGADRTVIDGNRDHRILDVHAANAALTIPGGIAGISNVSIRNGLAEFSAPTGHRHGGAIHNHGRLELSESTVSDSAANAGAPWGGGAITNAGNGTATLRNVTIARNSTTYFGGGVENGGTISFSYVTLSQNTAPAGPPAQGGGIASGVGFFQGAAGQATLQNTIVANNTADNCRGPTIVSAG